MFGIRVFPFIFDLLIFLETRAFFIDSSAFTVITAALTKQSSVISVARFKYPFFYRSFFLLHRDLVNELARGVFFVEWSLNLIHCLFHRAIFYLRVVAEKVLEFVLHFVDTFWCHPFYVVYFDVLGCWVDCYSQPFHPVQSR